MKAIEKALAMLHAEGFDQIGSFLGSHVLGLAVKERDEYVRFFSPQIISIHGGKALVGLIGSMDRKAISNWADIKRLSDYFAVSIFSANFPVLRDPPVFDISREDDQEWCGRIARITREFPTTQAELDHAISGAGIAGVRVDKMDTQSR